MFKIISEKMFVFIFGAFMLALIFGQAFLSLNNACADQGNSSYSSFVQTVNNNRQEGNPDANVTIIIYSDYQCPWCGLFEKKDLALIIKNYVKTGKIFIEYRDFPLTLIHRYAFKAAEYADCSALQGKYLQIRSLLYKDKSDWSIIGDIYYFLKTHAGSVLNLKEEQSCVNGKAEGFSGTQYVKRLIKSNMASGQRLNVTGTPTIFIYKGLILYKKIVGYRPYPQLNAILEGALR